MKTTVELAQEAGVIEGFDTVHPSVDRLVALVRADERERILDMCKEGLWDGEGIRFHLNKRGDT
jgi:hypothetical protein